VSAGTKSSRPSRTSAPPKESPLSDVRTRRRVARRKQSQRDILDAAEKVFGEDGIHNGSVRRIAELSGFSPGAIYLFFENKADLVTNTFDRRGKEWCDAIVAIAQGNASPLARLHEVMDWVITFLAEHPEFRALLSQVSQGSMVAGYSLAGRSTDDGYFSSIMTAIAGMIDEGQVRGDIRSGDPRSLAHLFSVLLNEYSLLDTAPGVGKLTAAQFHEFVGGALRVATQVSVQGKEQSSD
jgi:AcrR family transcriptional regulator